MDRWRLVVREDLVFHERVLAEGSTVLKYQMQCNARMAKRLWFPTQLGGYKWMAVNASGVNSMLWDLVWDDSFDGKLAFSWGGKHWTVSLYSDKIDCSVIARDHGGGGHAGAAGFQCQELPFNLRGDR